MGIIPAISLKTVGVKRSLKHYKSNHFWYINIISRCLWWLPFPTWRHVFPQSDVMYISSLYSTSWDPRLPVRKQEETRVASTWAREVGSSPDTSQSEKLLGQSKKPTQMISRLHFWLRQKNPLKNMSVHSQILSLHC